MYNYHLMMPLLYLHFSRRLYFGLLASSIWFLSATVHAITPAENLDRFFTNFKTFRADFTQVVLDENLEPLEESSGRLWIARPGRFRWDYHPPFAQQIVADGSRVWVYDLELEQVTVRDQHKTLQHTPAMLLSDTGNVSLDYIIEDLGRQGSVDWISLIPRNTDVSFLAVQLGFENGTLRLIQLLDQLEQVTRIVFSHVEENVSIPTDRFRFKVPSGVDLIEESF